jgi:outer membrane protein assembly factor BamD
MNDLKHNRFDVARLTLQTLINTYPDSEYIARAKLGVADSWYAEGGSTGYAQAEIEYKDFITFFPNMPEAAEAQYKIANIHYQQMEKPDRDYTHAMRAEDEYRQMILQYPDHKLIPQAKQRLLEVQEVLAEREFRVGRFYSLRQSYPAAIARLQSLVDRYPLYSGADEALFLLGQSYEGQIENLRYTRLPEDAKGRVVKMSNDGAAAAYRRLIERYPLADRAEDAKQRLAALHRPIPQPTREAMLRNKKEIESRSETGMLGQFMGQFRRHPDVAQTTRVGEPVLVDPKVMSATDIVQAANKALLGSGGSGGSTSLAFEPVKPASTPPADGGTPPADTFAPPGGATVAPPETPAYGELKPDAAPADNTPTPPTQVNEIQTTPPPATQDAKPADSTEGKPEAKPADQPDPNQDLTGISTSRPKKKKGLKKIIPF